MCVRKPRCSSRFRASRITALSQSRAALSELVHEIATALSVGEVPPRLHQRAGRFAQGAATEWVALCAHSGERDNPAMEDLHVCAHPGSRAASTSTSVFADVAAEPKGLRRPARNCLGWRRLGRDCRDVVACHAGLSALDVSGGEEDTSPACRAHFAYCLGSRSNFCLQDAEQK